MRKILSTIVLSISIYYIFKFITKLISESNKKKSQSASNNMKDENSVSNQQKTNINRKPNFDKLGGEYVPFEEIKSEQS